VPLSKPPGRNGHGRLLGFVCVPVYAGKARILRVFIFLLGIRKALDM